MKKKLFIFVLCVLIQGCATSSTLRLDPQALTGQKEVSQEGVDAVVSEKKVRVTVRPSTDTYSSEDRPTLVVSVYCTEEPFNFSTKNIQVFVDGNPHRVFTYDELVADIKEQEEKSIKRAKAMKEEQYRTPGGGAMAISSANKQMQARIQAIENKTKQTLEDLDSTCLKNIRVLPNKECGGHVTIEKIPNPSQSHEIKVIVTVPDEKHEFLLNQVKV